MTRLLQLAVSSRDLATSVSWWLFYSYESEELFRCLLSRTAIIDCYSGPAPVGIVQRRRTWEPRNISVSDHAISILTQMATDSCHWKMSDARLWISMARSFRPRDQSQRDRRCA